MARKKSPIRTWLNMRRLRWLLFRVLATAIPGLQGRLNFPVKAVRAIDCASAIIEDETRPVQLLHTEAEAADILAQAVDNDTGDTSGTGSGQGVMSCQAALISGCAILGHTRTIITQSPVRLVTQDGLAGNWNFVKPARLTSRPAAPVRHILLQGSGHIFHLFANGVLPLLRYLERQPCQSPAEKIVLVCPQASPGFEAEVLAALVHRFPQLELLPLGSQEKLVDAEVLWLLDLCSNYEWMPVDHTLADHLRQILETFWRAGGAAPAEGATAEKLYLDRGDAKLRRMRDDADIREVLEQHGYRSFVAHAGNFRDQVAAFSNAREVAAVHGAGLTNLLFCKPGTRVVEIFPENFVKSTYLWLARQLDLDYHYVIGGPGDYDQTFTAGADRLAAALRPAGPDHNDNRTS